MVHMPSGDASASGGAINGVSASDGVSVSGDASTSANGSVSASASGDASTSTSGGTSSCVSISGGTSSCVSASNSAYWTVLSVIMDGGSHFSNDTDQDISLNLYFYQKCMFVVGRKGNKRC